MIAKGGMIMELEWIENGYIILRAAKVINDRIELSQFVETFILMANPNTVSAWRVEIYKQADKEIEVFLGTRNIIRNFRQILDISMCNSRMKGRIKTN